VHKKAMMIATMNNARFVSSSLSSSGLGKKKADKKDAGNRIIRRSDDASSCSSRSSGAAHPLTRRNGGGRKSTPRGRNEVSIDGCLCRATTSYSRRRRRNFSTTSISSSSSSSSSSRGVLTRGALFDDDGRKEKDTIRNHYANGKNTTSIRMRGRERRKVSTLVVFAGEGDESGEGEGETTKSGEESGVLVPSEKNYDDDADDDEEPNFGVKPPELATFHRKTALFAISVGFAVFYGFPKPDVLTSEAWQLLAIFLATITGLVLKPLPVGAWAFGAMTVSLLTKTLTFDQALSSVSNQVVWLILVTAFFARAFVKTGFGDRLALLFVSVAGQSSLRLAYGFQLAEALLSPAMPSTTARAAGVFIPVIKSLDPRTQEYLVGQQLQGTGATSAFLMSGAAQNFLCMQIAIGMGIPFVNPFNEWAVAAFVPALICMLVTPLIVFIVDPPLLNATPKAPMEAAKKLQAMGPLTEIEKRMCLSLGTTVFLWVFGAPLGIAAVVAAMTGLCLMLISGVLSWDDALEQKGAWDTLIWFAILIGMSQQLNDLGVIEWLSGFVRDFLISWNLVGTSAFVALHLAYFLSHYMFASQSAHVGALYGAFLTMMIAGGVPPKLAAISLAMNTNTFGGLTHYASGQAAVYYGSGKIGLEKLWKQGLYVSCVHAFIWSTVGMAWWSICGIF